MNFIKLDVDIFEDEIFENITPTAFKLYCLLKQYSDYTNKPVFPSIKTLSKRMNKSYDTIRRSLRELEKLELIFIEKNNHKNYYYFEPLKNKCSDHLKISVPTTQKQVVQNSKNSSKITDRTPSYQLDNFANKNHSNKSHSNYTTTTLTSNQNMSKGKSAVVVTVLNDFNNLIGTIKIDKIKINKELKERLVNNYNDQFIDFILAYTWWVVNIKKVKIISLPAFIISLLKYPEKTDFSFYFYYLIKKIKDMKNINNTEIKQQSFVKKQVNNSNSRWA